MSLDQQSAENAMRLRVEMAGANIYPWYPQEFAILSIIDDLRAENAKLQQDGARLNFLQSLMEPDTRLEFAHYRVGEHKQRGDFVSFCKLTDVEQRITDGTTGFGASVRSAIDRAIDQTNIRALTASATTHAPEPAV